MGIGYLRVSKEERNEVFQMDALKKYGCGKTWLQPKKSQKFPTTSVIIFSFHKIICERL